MCDSLSLLLHCCFILQTVALSAWFYLNLGQVKRFELRFDRQFIKFPGQFAKIITQNQR